MNQAFMEFWAQFAHIAKAFETDHAQMHKIPAIYKQVCGIMPTDPIPGADASIMGVRIESNPLIPEHEIWFVSNGKVVGKIIDLR